eukprot:TRINITY_DN144_c0_g1_i3.p1 TRINITY_DN144_c0_g1~~TRINITY_DN144_c0_g1_i3.p1  ORF type:complete len:462 (-),score=96.18 TRINITY_DN144_c0_g1_i3:690-2075(-)
MRVQRRFNGGSRGAPLALALLLAAAGLVACAAVLSAAGAHTPRTINLAAAHSKPLHALSRAFSRLSMPKNGEISAQNTENGAENTENGAENTENGAENTENGAENTENGVQNAVFRAKSAENGAQNAEKAALFDDDDAAADMAERLLGHGRWARFFGVFRLKNTDFRAQNTVFRAQNADFRSKNADFGAGSGVLSPESGESGSKTGVFIAQTEAAVINFDIEDSDYQRRLAIIAVAPIVIGVLSFLTVLVFIVLRCCCGVCGRSATRRYEPADKRVTAGGSLFCGILIIIGGIIGYVGNSKVTDGIGGFFDAAKEAVSNLLQIGVDVNEILVKVGKSESSDISSAGNELNAEIDDVKTDALDFDKTRQNALNGVFALPILAVIFVILAMIVHLGPIAWVYILIAMVSLLLVWTILGVHAALNRAIKDMCLDIDIFVGEIALFMVKIALLGVKNGVFGCFYG